MDIIIITTVPQINVIAEQGLNQAATLSNHQGKNLLKELQAELCSSLSYEIMLTQQLVR